MSFSRTSYNIQRQTRLPRQNYQSTFYLLRFVNMHFSTFHQAYPSAQSTFDAPSPKISLAQPPFLIVYLGLPFTIVLLTMGFCGLVVLTASLTCFARHHCRNRHRIYEDYGFELDRGSEGVRFCVRRDEDKGREKEVDEEKMDPQIGSDCLVS